jgi:hypothetical protein
MLIPIDEIDMWAQFQTPKSIIALVHGDYEQAHTHLQKVLVHAEKLGNRFDYLAAQSRLGYLALRQGNISEVREVFAETAEEWQKNKFTVGLYSHWKEWQNYLLPLATPKTQRDRLDGFRHLTSLIVNLDRRIVAFSFRRRSVSASSVFISRSALISSSNLISGKIFLAILHILRMCDLVRAGYEFPLASGPL